MEVKTALAMIRPQSKSDFERAGANKSRKMPQKTNMTDIIRNKEYSILAKLIQFFRKREKLKINWF